mgnify:CR=1 FL=1
MRVLAAVLLLTGSLAGCVGNFTNERIDARYHSCMAHWEPERDSYTARVNLCEDNRQYDLDYRTSLRRFTMDITGGGGVTAPTPVIILN